MIHVAIVGADGTKWKEEQIPKVKLEINIVFTNWISHIIVEHGLDLKYNANKYITLVSGHCPVRKERQYCVNCDKFLDINSPDEIVSHQNHKIIKVYDKWWD